MAKITITGDACVITSELSMEDITTVAEYRPKSLALFETNDDGKKEQVFRIGVGPKGSMNQYGATFSGVTHDDDKKATITMILPAGVDDAKEYVAKAVGVGIVQLNKLEAALVPVISEIEAEKKAVLENITIA